MPPRLKSYKAEDVDANVKEFESFCAKLLAVADKAVKRMSAEKDVLKTTEHARDLMDVALKGDKYVLAEIFGGETKRCQRYRDAYDSLAALGLEKDARWTDLKSRIEAIEEIIAQLGTYKAPSKPEARPPTVLKYKRGVRGRISPRRQVQFRPETDGEECTFSIVGSFPEGLCLNDNGDITGSIENQTKGVELKIKAENASGSAIGEIKFDVCEPPPRGLSYPSLGGMLMVGSRIICRPEFSGAGVGRHYKVTPELPEGLFLDEKFGVISGAPVEKMDPKQFEILATNAGGESKVVVEFGAQVPPPEDLNYPDLVAAVGEKIVEIPTGVHVHFEPELGSGMPDEFTVSPALPEGLRLDKSTGEIRGVPTTPTPEQVYTVVALNDGGKAEVFFSLAVYSTVPTKLTYSGTESFPSDKIISFFNTTIVKLIAKIEGGDASGFKVEPPLPEGLVLSPTTGEISGIPTVCDRSSWEVTAFNDAGETSTKLEFAVTRAPPTDLSYPEMEPGTTYAAGRALNFYPTVAGPVNEYSVTPALPDGLVLDPETGIISGSLTDPSPETEYVVTAKNEVDSTEAKLRFGVKVLKPKNVKYPSADDTYTVGEQVGPAGGSGLVPEYEGSVDCFDVEPALPSGLVLDRITGIISGAPEVAAAQTDYVITATNKGGKAEPDCILSFKVLPPKPTFLEYPTLGNLLVKDEQSEHDPEIDAGRFKFDVKPALPDGVKLDVNTGKIIAAPTARTEETTFTITATNEAGAVSTEITFEVLLPGEVYITETFAEEIEQVCEVEALLEKQPNREKQFGDWMVWMVHRVHLNDPTLEDLNFNNHAMPLPYLQWKVAPKLMKALETNTHLKNLSLAKSNMQKPQGHELAAALKKNCSLKVINIESNYLDAECLRQIAVAISENRNSEIQQLRLSNQLCMGKYCGLPVEQAFATMLQKNETITTLGMTFQDRHWFDCINRYTLRNIDFQRRRAKSRKAREEGTEELPREDRTLRDLTLETPPEALAAEVMASSDSSDLAFGSFLVEKQMVPNPQQLKAWASRDGQKTGGFSELRKTIELCRGRLLASAQGRQVTVTDKYSSPIEGVLSKVTPAKGVGSDWIVEVIAEGKRLMCKGNKEPGIAISGDWVSWLKGEAPKKKDESLRSSLMDDAAQEEAAKQETVAQEEEAVMHRASTEDEVF